MTEAGAGEARKASAIEFEGVTPILRVGSLVASIEHYVKVLGFKVDWQNPGIMASVSRRPPLQLMTMPRPPAAARANLPPVRSIVPAMRTSIWTWPSSRN